MKINTTWSQENWNDALKKVWSLATDFEEILNFGLENGFITSSDIIYASDIYKDPNKEYDSEDLKEIIEHSDKYDVIEALKEKYSTTEIIDELDVEDILESIDDSDLLDALDGTCTLEDHDDNVRSEYYNDVIKDCVEELEQDNDEYMKDIQNWSNDDLHTFICDIVGCGYYDTFVFDKLKDKLKNNSYVSYDK